MVTQFHSVLQSDSPCPPIHRFHGSPLAINLIVSSKTSLFTLRLPLAPLPVAPAISPRSVYLPNHCTTQYPSLPSIPSVLLWTLEQGSQNRINTGNLWTPYFAKLKVL